MPPAVAPIVGGLLLGWGSWRTIFWALAGYGLVLVLLAAFFLPETHPPAARVPFHPRPLVASFRSTLDEAADAYRRVTELQPDSALGFHMLGTVQQAAGDTAAALLSYTRANEIRPAYGTWSNMGTILFWQGDYAKAADAYAHAIALAPNEPELYANLGDALRKLGRREEATASYRSAIDRMNALLAVNETDAPNLAVLAMYHAKAGDREAADHAIARAVALSPDDGDILYNRAIVAALAGDEAQACGALEQALAKGASAEIVRQTDELKSLKGCAAYDRVTGSPR